jgi:hypothetical protein
MAAQPSKARESTERKLVMVKNLPDPFTRGFEHSSALHKPDVFLTFWDQTARPAANPVHF